MFLPATDHDLVSVRSVSQWYKITTETQVEENDKHDGFIWGNCHLAEKTSSYFQICTAGKPSMAA
jgi:hypothetical protein